jgi:hypothetical protein
MDNWIRALVYQVGPLDRNKSTVSTDNPFGEPLGFGIKVEGLPGSGERPRKTFSGNDYFADKGFIYLKPESIVQTASCGYTLKEIHSLLLSGLPCEVKVLSDALVPSKVSFSWMEV